MDGAANPYLMQAAVLAAGLDGVANNRNPGKRHDINMYEYRTPRELKKLGLQKLPLNLLDALRITDESKVLRAGLGDELINSYVKLKMVEWNNYSRYLTQWERDNTLDC